MKHNDHGHKKAAHFRAAVFQCPCWSPDQQGFMYDDVLKTKI